MTLRLYRLVLSAICLTGPLACYAEDNPLAKYLEVLGAKTTLPISSAKSPFPLDFAQDARKRFGNFHLQMGGDHAIYYNLHMSELLHTAMSKPNAVYRPLEKALAPDLGDKVSFTTKEGELTLNSTWCTRTTGFRPWSWFTRERSYTRPIPG